MQAARSRPPHGGIIVLGMHRSGTSAACRLLAELGYSAAGPLMEANEANPLGYFENLDVVSIHDTFLSSLGRSWLDPRPFDVSEFESHPAVLARREIQNAFQSNLTSHDGWMIKDPRMCRLLPLWRPILDESGIRATFLHVVRHPVDVARSLARRESIRIETALQLWLRHVLEADLATRDCSRIWWSLDRMTTDPEESLADLASHLGLEIDIQLLQRTAATAFHSDLLHSRVGEAPPPEALAPFPWLESAYSAVQQLTDGDEAGGRALLDDVNDQLAVADRLLVGQPESFRVAWGNQILNHLYHEIRGIRSELANRQESAVDSRPEE